MPRKGLLGTVISDQERFFAQKEARMRIHVNSDGRFQIPLPRFAEEVLGYGRVGGATKDEVLSAWRKAENDYVERMKEKQKVIVYKIKVNAFVWNEDKTKCVFRADEIKFGEGTGLIMDWGVLYRHTRSDVEEISYHREDGKLVTSENVERRHITWIPWTQEAEDFFSECQKRLETLGMNLWNFLHQQPDLIESQIREAQNLLEYRGQRDDDC